MVKCSECGLLGFRNRQTLEIDEAVERIRHAGDFPSSGSYTVHDRVPICLLGIFPLRAEIRAEFLGQGKNSVDADRASRDPGGTEVLAVIGRERPCDDSTEWKEGFAPKEHLEMIDRKWMKEEAKKAARENRIWRVLEFIGVIIGLVLIVAAAFISQS